MGWDRVFFQRSLRFDLSSNVSDMFLMFNCLSNLEQLANIKKPPSRNMSNDSSHHNTEFLLVPLFSNEKWQAARLLLACWAAVCSWDQGFLAAEAWEQAPWNGAGSCGDFMVI